METSQMKWQIHKWRRTDRLYLYQEGALALVMRILVVWILGGPD